MSSLHDFLAQFEPISHSGRGAPRPRLTPHNPNPSPTHNPSRRRTWEGGQAAAADLSASFVAPRAVAAIAAQALPTGWRPVPSRSRPGQTSYENLHTRERIAWRPTEAAPTYFLRANRARAGGRHAGKRERSSRRRREPLHAHNRCDGDGGDGGEEKEDAGVALAMAVVAARQQHQQHRDAESFANAPSSHILSSSTSFPSSSSFTAAPLLADAMLLAARLRSTCVSTNENTSMTTAARNDENTVSSSSSAPSLIAAALADPSVMVVSEVSSAVVLAQRDNQALLAGEALEEAKIQHAAHAAALSAEGENPDFPPGFDPEDSKWIGVLRVAQWTRCCSPSHAG